jgi:hypothetical protein
MNKIGRIAFITGLSAYLSLSAISPISAQEANDGQLGTLSSGRAHMSLEITNGQNPTLTLVNSRGSASKIPGFLEDTIIRRLGEQRTVEFPVCLGGSGENEVTVSVDSADASEMMLTGLNGAQIPYKVNIKGNRAVGSDNDQKVQYLNPENGHCDEDTALIVQVTLSDERPLASAASLRGRFRLTITAE